MSGRKAGGQEGRWAGRQEGRKAGRQAGRKAGRQEGRKAGRQEGRWAGRQKGQGGRKRGVFTFLHRTHAHPFLRYVERSLKDDSHAGRKQHPVCNPFSRWWMGEPIHRRCHQIGRAS